MEVRNKNEERNREIENERKELIKQRDYLIRQEAFDREEREEFESVTCYKARAMKTSVKRRKTEVKRKDRKPSTRRMDAKEVGIDQQEDDWGFE